jgi:predicted short-subunit dehydrogenase-like oxidoreductase (DUF2520 family)
MAPQEGRPGRLGVGVIGMGHVGPVLGSALRAAGHALVGVSASSEESRERADAMLPGVPVLEVPDIVRRAEMVLIAIPDDQIAPLVAGLAGLGAWQPGQLVVHTSGAHGFSVLDPARRRGAIPLAIHPAMTFTGTSLDVARLEGIPFAVTAPTPVLPIGQALVVEMGGEPVVVGEAQRALYHAALAHGANHLVTLVVEAGRALADAGVGDPGSYMRPLLEAALDRALRDGEGGLSGPVERGDAGTVTRHMRALLDAGDLDDVADTYAHMAEATVRMLERSGRLSERAATRLRAALALGDLEDE